MRVEDVRLPILTVCHLLVRRSIIRKKSEAANPRLLCLSNSLMEDYSLESIETDICVWTGLHEVRLRLHHL